MKVSAIMKTGLASSPAYSELVFEIDITVSIRGQRSVVILSTSTDSDFFRKCYESPEGIDQDWEIISAPIMYNSPTSLDYKELHALYLELYAHVLEMYRERKLSELGI